MKVKDLEAASSDALGRVFGGLRTRAKVAMRRKARIELTGSGAGHPVVLLALTTDI